MSYDPCECPRHEDNPKPLTPLILQCWQRDTFERPYNHLRLDRRFFVNRLHREFDVNDYETLIQFLQKREGIKKIIFSSFRIPPNTPNDLHIQFAKTLQIRSEVELLNLELPVIFFKSLFEDQMLTRIKVLRLNGTPISEGVAHLLRCFLLWNSFIEYLDVGCCNITERYFSIIADGVYNSSSVTIFNMDRLVLQYRGDKMDTGGIANIIAQLIWKNQLVELHAQKIFLNSQDMIPIAEYIGEKNSTLKYLDIGTNLLQADGVEILFKNIARSKRLIGLDLSHNLIGDDGGEIIGFLLPFTNIKHLNISYNGIDFNGMHVLLSTVKKSAQLKIFNIFGNKFDPETTYKLKRQLKAHTLVADDMDIDVIYDNDKEEFYFTPQIKIPLAVGEQGKRFVRPSNKY